MKVVAFQNTQGVEVQYVCADVVERILAFVLDTALVFFVVLIIASVFDGLGSTGDNILMLFVMIPLFFFYHLISEMFNDGRSIGKMIIGLKVVRVDGMPLKTNDLLLRWLFRMIDIMVSLGAVAAVFSSVSPRSQRLGDMMADTTVIKTKQRKTRLERVMKLGALTKHEPKFMKKVAFSEEQMLLMKEVYDRASKYPSEENKEMASDLASNVAATLEVKPPKDPLKFLMAVVKDYVSITR